MIDNILGSDTLNHSVCRSNKSVPVSIVLRVYPFPFHYPPESFGNVEMRRIWRKVEYVEATGFPFFKFCLERLALVNGRIVKYEDCQFLQCAGETVKKLYEILGLDASARFKPMIDVVPVGHAEHTYARAPLGRNIYIFAFELPAVRHIASRTEMGLISVEKFNMAVIVKSFKFLQNLDFVLVDLRRGLTPWAKSYSLISCAISAKKFLSVEYPTFRPVSASHSAFASLIRWRCLAIFALSNGRSAAVSAGLRRCMPVLVRNASVPPILKDLIQLNTDAIPQSSTLAMDSAVIPSPFRRMALQRIRKDADSPLRKPFSNSLLCESVNDMMLACLIVVFLYGYYYYNNCKHRANYIKQN